jgi:hypothetical protein
MAKTTTPAWRHSLLALIALICTTVVASRARAGEAYYVLVFSAQRTPAQPNYAHSFATFVRATWPGEGPCPQAPATLEAHTISWLPANLVIRTWAFLPECGHNFELTETLRFALDTDQRISLWGPHQIEPSLYHRALRQKALLESGDVLYKADDTMRKPDRVSNCIHAVSSVAEGYRLRVASPGWGETASHAIMKRFRPWVIDEDQVHAWVGSALGLDAYPIIYRDWQAPRSGAIIGPAYRLLGGERNLRPSYGPPR